MGGADFAGGFGGEYLEAPFFLWENEFSVARTGTGRGILNPPDLGTLALSICNKLASVIQSIETAQMAVILFTIQDIRTMSHFHCAILENILLYHHVFSCKHVRRQNLSLCLHEVQSQIEVQCRETK